MDNAFRNQQDFFKKCVVCVKGKGYAITQHDGFYVCIVRPDLVK